MKSSSNLKRQELSLEELEEEVRQLVVIKEALERMETGLSRMIVQMVNKLLSRMQERGRLRVETNKMIAMELLKLKPQILEALRSSTRSMESSCRGFFKESIGSLELVTLPIS
jgi:hypothetical protein